MFRFHSRQDFGLQRHLNGVFGRRWREYPTVGAGRIFGVEIICFQRDSRRHACGEEAVDIDGQIEIGPRIDQGDFDGLIRRESAGNFCVIGIDERILHGYRHRVSHLNSVFDVISVLRTDLDPIPCPKRLKGVGFHPDFDTGWITFVEHQDFRVCGDCFEFVVVQIGDRVANGVLMADHNPGWFKTVTL